MLPRDTFLRHTLTLPPWLLECSQSLDLGLPLPAGVLPRNETTCLCFHFQTYQRVIITTKTSADKNYATVGVHLFSNPKLQFLEKKEREKEREREITF